MITTYVISGIRKTGDVFAWKVMRKEEDNGECPSHFLMLCAQSYTTSFNVISSILLFHLPSYQEGIVFPLESLSRWHLLNFPYWEGRWIITETHQERHKSIEIVRIRCEDYSDNEIMTNSSKMKKAVRKNGKLKLEISRRGVRTAKVGFRWKQFTKQILLWTHLRFVIWSGHKIGQLIFFKLTKNKIK